MLKLLHSKIIFHSSFRKFSQTLLAVQNTSSLLAKKQILNIHFNNQNQKNQQSIINIVNFIRDKPKTGLAKKSLINFLINRYFEHIEQQNNFDNDIDTIIDNLENTQWSGIEGIVKLQDVQNLLQKLQQIEGKNAIKNKFKTIEQIIENMNIIEIRMFFRIINKNLRIGLADKSISFNKQELLIQKQINQDVLQQPQIANKTIKKQAPNLSLSQVPSFQFMLAKPLKNISDLQKFCISKGKQKLYADLKYDGQRTLIVYKKNFPLELTSRNKKSQTQNYKSLTGILYQQLQKITQIDSIQIDGQLLCVDKNGEHLPIQTLFSKRGKQSVEDQNSHILVYAFDVLSYNGIDCKKKQLKYRRKLIPTTQHIKVSQLTEIKYPQQKQDLINHFKSVVSKNREGLIIKGQDDYYLLNGSRRHWAKLKKGFKIQQTDTGSIDLDLVVMGIYYGQGKRSQFIAAYLVGTYENEKLYPVSKVGTGFTDEKLEQYTKIFEQIIVKQKPGQFQIPKVLRCDAYVEPKYVFKVTCLDLTRSPLYKLSEIPGKGGISLRHPVFQCIRDDKDPKSCVSSDFMEYLIPDTK